MQNILIIIASAETAGIVSDNTAFRTPCLEARTMPPSSACGASLLWAGAYLDGTMVAGKDHATGPCLVGMAAMGMAHGSMAWPLPSNHHATAHRRPTPRGAYCGSGRLTLMGG